MWYVLIFVRLMERIENTDFFTSGAVLMADASGARISVLAAGAGGACGMCAEGGVLENMFALISKAADAAGFSARSARAFGFCSGPGSILGIRASAAAMATFREAAPGSALFSWGLFDAYSELLLRSGKSGFSLVCPSRRGYANVLEWGGGPAREIPSSGVASLCGRPLLIRQRSVADPAFAGLGEVFFGCGEVFELLKSRPGLARVCGVSEIPDASVLAKREYVKWNSQPRP